MRSKLDTAQLPFMGRDLVPKDTARYPGVTLDANLIYDEHITKNVSIQQQLLALFARP